MDPRQKRIILIFSVATVMFFVGIVVSHRLDFPSFPDEPPWQLEQAVGAKLAEIDSFSSYNFLGFLDTESLWRVKANPDIAEQIVQGLHVQSTKAVPQEFWRMPPWYWPRSLPENAELYQTAGFETVKLGDDGNHYFVVYDKSKNTLFVWHKFFF